jgi:N-acetylmuramoyl-L-alanine amidase
MRTRIFMALLAAAVVVPSAPASASPRVPPAVQFEHRMAQPDVEAATGRHALIRDTVRTGRLFNFVGLHWRGGGAGTLWLRTRTAQGWSRWTAVPVDSDDSPDLGTPELRAGDRYSDPVWAGQANAVEFKLRPSGRIRDLRLRFLNTSGTATAALRRRGRAHASLARPIVPAPGAPPIISRDEWGAASCPPRATPAYGEVKFAFVHHTVTTNDYAPSDSAAIVRGICLYHRNSNGWNDIGYNFLVDKYGQIFEGRAGGMDAAVVGAQAQGYNTQSTGIANLGTFSNAGQTAAGLDALARLLSWKLAVHGVPPTGTVVVTSGGGSLNRYPAGTAVTFQRISGHRDGDATACPGDGLYSQLPQLRQMVTAGPLAARPSVSLAARAATITYGSKATLSGRLTAPGGEPLAGTAVEIQLLGRSGAWKTLHQVRTDATGTFGTNVRLTYNHGLRARFAGAPGLSQTQSKPIAIGVRPLVTAQLAPSTSAVVRRGGRIFVEGRVKPAKRYGFLLVYRLGRDSKKRVGRRVARLRSGKMRAGFVFSRRGSYVVRLGVLPDRRNIGGRSHAISITVR